MDEVRFTDSGLTKNYSFGIKKYGMLAGMRGGRQNDTFRLYHKEKCYLGRDDKQCHVVIAEKDSEQKTLRDLL